jgi:hypothetical protein
MFSSASSVGTRLNAWNTKPRRSRRTRVSCFSLSVLRSTSPMKTWPLVTVSRPASTWSSVDLPEPEGPMIAVNAPRANSTSMASRARTSASPDP